MTGRRLVSGFAFTGLALLLVLASPVGTYIAAGVLTRVAADSGWQASITATSGWLAGNPTLHGVSLRSEQGDVAIRAARISMSLWSSQLLVLDPTVSITLNEGREPTESAAPEPPPRLPIAELPAMTLTGGMVEVRNAVDSLLFVAEGLDVQSAAGSRSPEDAEPTISARLTLKRVLIPASGANPLIDGAATARLLVSPDRVRVEELVINAALTGTDLAARAEGLVSLQSNWPIDIELHASEADPGKAGKTSSRRASTRLHGTLSPLALDGDLSATFTDSTVGEVRLHTGVTFTEERVSLDSARVDLLGGEVSLRATYAFEADSAVVDVEATNLQAERIGFGFTGGLSGALLDGRLEVTARPSSSIYAGSLRARVTGARLLDQVTHTINVEADLASSGHLGAAVETDLGRLAVVGELELSTGISYDLALAGHIDPTAILGEAVSRLMVSGQLRPGDLQVQLRAGEVSYLHDVIGPVGVDLQLVDGRYLNASVVVEGDQAHARLKADLESGRLDTLEAVVSPLLIDRVVAAAAGDLEAQLSGGGGLGLSTAVVSGQIALGNLQLSGWTVGDITAGLTVEEGVGRVELTGAGISMVASVDTSGAFAGEATLAGARFDAADSGDDDSGGDHIIAAGRGHWAGSLSTSIDHWVAGLELDSLSAQLSGYAVRSDGPVRIQHAGQTTTIDSTRWHTPLGALLVAGTIGDELTLTAAIDSLTLSTAVPKLAGGGSARLEVTGSLQEPRAIGMIDVRELTMGGHPVGDLTARLALGDSVSADSLTVTVFLDQSSLQAATLTDSTNFRRALSMTLRAGADAVRQRSQASNPTDERVALNVEAVGLDLSGPLSHVLEDSLSAHLGLLGALSFVASNLTDWNQVEGRLEIDRLDFGNAAARVGLRAMETTFVHMAKGSRIDMPAAAVFSIERFDEEEQQFETAGRLSITTATESGHARISVELEEVDLRVVEALSSGSIELPIGTIDASLTIDDSTQGTGLQLSSTVYFDDAGELLLGTQANATDLHLQAAWVTPVLDSLVVTVDAPWRMRDREVAWEAGRLRARSEGFNLFILLDQVPQLHNLDGFAQVDLEVLGLAGRSQVSGAIEIEDLVLSLPDVSPGYAFPHGALRFDGSGGRGEIDFVGGPDRGRGRLELSGFVDLSTLGDPEYEFVVTAQSLPYRYEETFEVADLDLRLALRRTDQERLLSGEINIDGATIEPTLVNFNATTVPPPPALKNPFLESTALDIYLDLRNTQVKNEFTNMMLEGSSRLYGTFYKPRLQGEILLLPGGVINILSREFTLTQGRIGLDRLVPTYSILDLAYDPLLLNPELAIESVANVWNHDDQEETEVTMTLSGTALLAQPRFSSAGLGDAEVISLLAFGSTGSFRTDDLYTAAGQLLLRRQVSRVGLDEFALLPSGTVIGGVGETSVRVGKFFSFLVPVWVRYETPTSLPSRGQVELEYKLGSVLNVKASSQSKYDLYGAGIGVKKSF